MLKQDKGLEESRSENNSRKRYALVRNRIRIRRIGCGTPAARSVGVRPPPYPHPPSGITGSVAITDMTSEHMNFPLGKSITIRNLCPSIEYNNILLLGMGN